MVQGCRGQTAADLLAVMACVHEWKIRSSPWYVRKEVKKRDKGICKLCGFNVVKAHREWTRSKPPATDVPPGKHGAPCATLGSRQHRAGCGRRRRCGRRTTVCCAVRAT